MKDARPNKQASPGADQGWVLVVAVAAGVLLLLAGLVAGAVTVSGVAPAGGGVGAWARAVVQSWLGGTTGGTVGGTVGSAQTGPSPAGSVLWSPQTSLALACELVLVVVLVVVPVVAVLRRARVGREWTDSLARSMSTTRDLAELTEAAVTKDTARLGASACGIGVRVGRAVLGRGWLYGTFEWSQLWVMGTRAGKTRSVAVPQIVEHLGPIVTTSNKRDVHDLTFGPRSELGRVWVNDPQGVAEVPPAWWWDPLSYVTTVERAEKLVAIWAASRTTEDTSGVDPYFEPEGRSLAATLLMTAALTGEPITRLPDWLTGEEPAPGVPNPSEILWNHGYREMSKDIDKLLRLDKGQRDGVYGTAMSFFRFLRDPRYVQWIAPLTAPTHDGAHGEGDDDGARDAGERGEFVDERPRFDPAAFVRAPADTLYLFSREGPGSARAVTGALVAAVYAAAEELAVASGGRCQRPVLFVLDEAANVCRWPELPSLYSHAGGQGIILVTILQSVPQGSEAFGRSGMEKMWSAANILVVGRGLNDADNLGDVSRLVGDRQIRQHSLSTGRQGHRSVSASRGEERILTEADLRALPRGRAVLFSSGARSILLEVVDFSQHPWAPKAEASRGYCLESHRTTPQTLAGGRIWEVPVADTADAADTRRT